MLIVGLGNPGRRYEKNRHNVGFMVLDALRTRWRGGAWERLGPAETCRAAFGGLQHLLARPLTYMNRSGEALKGLLPGDEYDIPDLLVVLDDMDLPLGRMRLRPRGSAGGHKGLSSILEALGTEEVARLRIGIGRPPTGVDPVDYVLSDFGPDEAALLEQVIEKSCEAIEVSIQRGLESGMSLFNGVDLARPREQED